MVTCNRCGNTLGQGDVVGLAFCNDDCAFAYAMKIPLDTLTVENLPGEKMTMGEGVILLMNAKK